jgi:hypothetical protein
VWGGLDAHARLTARGAPCCIYNREIEGRLVNLLRHAGERGKHGIARVNSSGAAGRLFSKRQADARAYGLSLSGVGT